jgi:hypothetical protein
MMSIALSNAIPPVPPQPTALPTQVQLAQGSAVPVAALAVTANDKRENAKESKNETDSKPEQNDRRRGKLIDRFA